MTKLIYEQKRAAIASSLAHPRIKADALKELDEKFYGTDAIDIAMQQIEESKPDTSDIGDGQ